MYLGLSRVFIKKGVFKMKEMKICVRSLSTGVEKDWITPLEALAFMEEQEQKDGSEEFIIVDYDAPFVISKYDSVEELADLMEEIEAFSDDEVAVLETILSEYTSNFNEALEIVRSEAYTVYYGCCSMEEVEQQFCEEYGMLDEVPGELLCYFDFEAYGRDLEIEGKFFELTDGSGIMQIY